MKTLFKNTVHFTITIASFILIACIVLFSNKAGQIELSVGDVSPSDIYASRTIIDKTTTEASRKAAYNSVENVYVCNENQRLSAVETANSVFSLASTLRSEDNSTSSANAAQLSAKAKIYLSNRASSAIIAAPDSEFSRFRGISNIIDKIMTDGVSDVDAAKKLFAKEIDKIDISESLKNAGNEIAEGVISVNLELDEKETQRRREEAASSVAPIEYKKNQIILRKGEIASSTQIEMLTELGILKGSNPIPPTYIAGIIIITLICFVILLLYFAASDSKTKSSALISSVLALLTVLVAFYGSKYVPEKFMPLLPVGFFVALLSTFSNSFTSLLANALVSVFCAITFDSDWKYAISLILGGAICAFCFGKVKRRSHLIQAVAGSALGYGFTFFAVSLIETNDLSVSLVALLLGILGGVFSGIVTIGSLPFLEWLFNATTPMKLSELANPENKLLKKLLIEAPGTYHHSLTVANISEIAAREINANSLLARVGAYYHDIGKLRHPQCFKENQYNGNLHDSLPPLESSELIVNHVTAGVEIASKNRLPQSICDIIAQHHGTTTTGYFLIRAKELDPDVDPELFSYHGPTPQTKEAAIVMLADSCEAAVRSLSEKNEEKIESMVRRIVSERVNSGQLSECNLTFAELETIIKVMIKTIGGYFHERIKYE